MMLRYPICAIILMSNGVAHARLYANTCVEPQSGDVAGYVVDFHDRRARPRLSFAWSEGALMAPVDAQITMFDRLRGRIAFAAAVPGGRFRFSGALQSTALEGTLMKPANDAPRSIILRMRSYAAAYTRMPPCRT